MANFTAKAKRYESRKDVPSHLDISSQALHQELTDDEDESARHSYLQEQFKMGEETETPTVFIIPGDHELNIGTNGRLDDSGESVEPRPLFDDRASDYDDAEKTKDGDERRGDSREHFCSCVSCKNERNRHEKRRGSDCHSHCSHHEHGSFHGECGPDRCHSRKESRCHGDSCYSGHCNKSSDHGPCHHGYHDSHRQCHEQFCSGSHCHGNHCHGDSCYPKMDWREYFMNDDDHRFRSKVHKHTYGDRFLSERAAHRNPFESYPPHVPDNMFLPPDPLLMNYNQRRGGAFHSSSTKGKSHVVDRNTLTPGYPSARKHSDSELSAIDAIALTKNATKFKGNARGFDGDSRHPARGDILTAPGSAIRRMKELVSKYSDRQVREVDDQGEALINRPLPPELADNEETEMQGTQGDQVMEKQEAYVCHICGKEFAWAITLKRHMLIHTGVRQYQCNICNKAFTRSHHLKRHMTVHTGEKPYVCHICNKAYSRSDRLSSHMNNHEGYVSNKKRGRMPLKTPESITDGTDAAVEKRQEVISTGGDLKLSSSKESTMIINRETESGPSTRESVGVDKGWPNPPSLDQIGVAREEPALNEPWNTTGNVETGPPQVRIISSEPPPWYSRPETRPGGDEEEGRQEQLAEDQNVEKKNSTDIPTHALDIHGIGGRGRQSHNRDEETSDLKPDLPVSLKHSPHYSKPPDSVVRSSPYQSFTHTRVEKETFSKYKSNLQELRPSDFHPPDFFPPPGFPMPGPPSFIPGSILDTNPKDAKLSPFSGHAPMFRHDDKRPRSPMGQDLHDRGGVPFITGDPAKFGFGGLLNARNDFINKQRIGHPSMLYHEMPHDVNNRDSRQDGMMIRPKQVDEREQNYGNELQEGFQIARKDEGNGDDAKNDHMSSGEDSASGLQSKFKVQLTQRDVKGSIDMKPPDPHMNLFTFRHMVHQPGRPRATLDNAGQKRVLPRTFVCRTCNKAFTRSHHLRRHELIHSGQKPFKCTICGRAFNRSDHLNLHLATHYQSANGPRPYNRDAGKGKKKGSECSIKSDVDGEGEKMSAEMSDQGPIEMSGQGPMEISGQGPVEMSGQLTEADGMSGGDSLGEQSPVVSGHLENMEVFTGGKGSDSHEALMDEKLENSNSLTPFEDDFILSQKARVTAKLAKFRRCAVTNGNDLVAVVYSS
eukprot:gene5037-146_t